MAKSKSQSEREKLFKGVTVKQAQEADDGMLPDVPEFVENFPVLNAMMCCNEVDGKPRRVATLTFWVEENGIKCVFADRQTKQKLWRTVSSLGHLWAELEAELTSDTPDWRNDAGTKSRRR